MKSLLEQKLDRVEALDKAATLHWRQGTTDKTKIWSAFPEGLGGSASERVILTANQHYDLSADIALAVEYRELAPAIAAECRRLLALEKNPTQLIQYLMSKLTKDERAWILSDYCHSCGGADLPCHCENDE